MSNTCVGCVPRTGYSQLKADILEAQARHILAPVPIEMIFACGIIESNGNMFFDGTEEQYRANLNVFKARANLNTADALHLVRVGGGKNQGKIAKFRYEPSWALPANEVLLRRKHSEQWRTVLCLGIGYFQKGMVWHLAGKPSAEWQGAYDKFLKDPLEQVRVCANDLHILMRGTQGDMKLAFTRYNAGASATEISNYGERAYDLYKNLVATPLRRN